MTKNINQYMEEYIHISKYAKWVDSEKRREIDWPETVSRYINHFEKSLGIDLEFLKGPIIQKKVMPSMRAIMTAGKALERCNTVGYNCAAIAVNHPRVFDEHFYLLMGGSGVGFSVERQYINQLPEISEEMHDTDTTIVVRDSRPGWAKAFKELIALLYNGDVPKYDVSKVRKAGERLKIMGGRASGPEPLERLFQYTIRMFKNAKGRKLNSAECHKLMCKIAETVIVGSVRRSACISFGNLTDDRHRRLKIGEFWIHSPELFLSNNSVMYTEKPDLDSFTKEFRSIYGSKAGERGIVNQKALQQKAASSNREHDGAYLLNPCAEAILRDSGGLCNLSEVIIRPDDTLDTLKEKVKFATIIGTIQSTMTNFKYLRKVWSDNAKEERLLGVSFTGIMDHEIMSTPECKDWLIELKKVAIETNKEWAKKLGINESKQLTLTKPSGCQTLESKIKTTDGIKSFLDIFNDNGIDIFDHEDHTWLEPNHDIFVYDENNDIQKITKLFVNGVREVYDIEDENGIVHSFTGNHKLKTVNGWKRVDELRKGDNIISFHNDGNIKSIKKRNEPAMTVDIEVENTHTYQLSNGMVSHNTVSQLCSTSSGIHPRYSKYYIRRVTQDNKDPLTQLMVSQKVPHVVDGEKTYFEFPIKSPENTRLNISTKDQLELWLIYRTYWCDGNPSQTIYYTDDTFLMLQDWIWQNWDHIGGLSFFPKDDHIYENAPNEEISEEKYLELAENFPEIDWRKLKYFESEDSSKLEVGAACSGGACEI